MKGWKFQPGNKFGCGQQQARHQDREAAVSATSSSPYGLRSKPGNNQDRYGSMRLIHLKKNCELWNHAIREHRRTARTCQNPQFWPSEEQKRGLVIAQRLQCMNCDFVTPLFKLYEEVDVPVPSKPGPKPAVQNVALQNAIVDTTIGQSKVRSLLSSLDLAPPAKSHMHQTSKLVGDELVKLGQLDMSEKLAQVTKQDKTLHIAADTRYNTSRPASSRRTGVSTTSQAITLALEKNSGQNYIVSSFTQNKLCPKGAFLQSQGQQDVTCPGGHPDCIANVNKLDSLTEFTAGQQIGEQLMHHGVTVTHCTTDGDSRFVKGLEEAMKTKVQRLADTVHLGQTQVKRAKKRSFSDSLFPGVKTKKAKEQCKHALAADLKNRSSVILKNMHKQYKGDTDLIKAAMPAVVDAVVMCYSGNCSRCLHFSGGTCAAGDSSDNWIMKSRTLSEQHISVLQPNQTDVQQIRDILNIVLGEEGIEKTKFMTNTQLNEAANRALSATLPKNIKFSRNLEARKARAILKWNNGPGVATAKQNVHLGLPTSQGQRQYLQRQQQEHDMMRRRVRNANVQARRHKRDSKLRLERVARMKTRGSDYRKHQLDDSTDEEDSDDAAKQTQPRRSARLDHCYQVSV